MAGNKDVRRGIVLYLDGKEVKNNAVAIRAEMQKVKKEIDSCTIGSEEYVSATRKYQELNAILAEHKARLKAVGDNVKQVKAETDKANAASRNWLKWGIGKFNEYSVAILGMVAAMTGVTMKLISLKKMAGEKEDSQANLKALTGLDDKSIEWLTKQAETLSTTMDKTGLRVRKTSKEILDAYMLVGSAKPELLSDKEALNAVTVEAMRLAEAAKMNLKDAVDGLTLALNQYGDGADKAARYVNVLAAGSKAGAAGVEAQTASIVKSGVAASVANVSIEQLVGSIETLAEKGIKGEIAGTGLKTFFLKLEGGARECRPSVVGLQTALENLQAKGLSAAEMQKMFGLEAYTVAQAMISGAASVKKYTEAVTDTNVATEQAAINGATTVAQLEQTKNRLNEMGMVLAKRLAPVFSSMTNMVGKFIKVMPAMLDFIEGYGLIILEVAAALALLSTRVAVAQAATKAYNAVVAAGQGIHKAYTASMIAMRLAMSGCTAAQITLTRTIVSSNAIQKAAIAMAALWKAAMFAMTGQTAAATVALKAFRIVLATVNPFTLAVAAITSAAVAFTAFYKAASKAREAHKGLKELNNRVADEYDRESAKLMVLNKQLRDNTLSIEKRKKALRDIKEVVRNYHGDLTKEGKLINDNKEAIDDYLASLEKRIRLNAAQEELEEKIRAKRKKEREYEEAKKEQAQAASFMYRSTSVDTGPGSGGAILGLSIFQGMKDRRVESLRDDIESLKEDIEDLYAEVNSAPAALKVEAKNAAGGGAPVDAESEQDKKKRVKKALEDIEAESNAKLSAMKKMFIEGEIESEEEYNRQIELIEIERLKRSMEVAGLGEGQREELANKMLDIYVNAKKKVDEIINYEEEGKNTYSSRLKALEQEKEKELAVIKKAQTLELISEEEHEEAVLLLEKKYQALSEDEYKNSSERKKLLSRLSESYDAEKFDFAAMQKYGGTNIAEYLSIIKKEIDNAETMLLGLDSESDEYKMVEDYMDGLIEIYNEKGKVLVDVIGEIGTAIGESLGNALAGEEVKLKEVLKTLLQTVLDAIEKMITATMMIPTLKMLTGIGAASALKDLAKIALVKTSFAALKAAVDGWQDGGYTGKGRPDEPAGIVHRGEFVANRYALANPAVNSVLGLIDAAQKAGSVQNLTDDDIRAVVPGATKAVVAPAPVAQNVIQYDNRELIDTLDGLNDVMAEASRAFAKPARAYCYLEGEGGINSQQEMLKLIKNNAKR